MAVIRPVLNDFSAGEISPRLAGRIDLGVYQKGAQEITNFQVRTLGGLSKRPGTELLGRTRSDAQARLIPWVIDPTLTLIIEMTPGHIRLFDAATKAFTSTGAVTTDIVTAYDTTGAFVASPQEIFQAKYAQTAREIFIVHRSQPPIWIRFVSGTPTSAVVDYTTGFVSFAGNVLNFDSSKEAATYDASALWEKMATWLDDTKLYTATGTFNGKTVTFVRREDLGLNFRIYFDDTSQLAINRSATALAYAGTISVELTPFMGAGNYPSAACFHSGRLWMGGTDNDPATVWGSKPWDHFNFVLFESVEYQVSEKTTATRIDAVGTTTAGSTDVTDISAVISGTPGAARYVTGKYATAKNLAYGVKVASVLSTSSVRLDTAAIVSGICSLSFSEWKNADIPEYAEVTKSTLQVGAASGVRLKLATEEHERILWISGGRDLLVGTEASEWIVAGSSNGQSAKAELASRYGSADIQPRFVGDALMYVTSGSRHIRQFSAGTPQPPLTLQAEHMAREGITQLDFAQSPDLCLYAVLANGELARCLLEPSAGVVAWDRIRMRTNATPSFSDRVESVAVTPGVTRDNVYVVVRRKIGANYYRFIEAFAENLDDTLANRRYLDCSVYGENVSSLAVGTSLDGEVLTVRVESGGVESEIASVVVSGAAPLGASYAKAWAGLPYTATLKTHRIEGMDTEGLTKGVGRVFFRMFRSFGFTLRHAASSSTVPVTTPDGALYTGPLAVVTDMPTLLDAELIIESTAATSVGIQTIVPDTSVGG